MDTIRHFIPKQPMQTNTISIFFAYQTSQNEMVLHSDSERFFLYENACLRTFIAALSMVAKAENKLDI